MNDAHSIATLREAARRARVVTARTEAQWAWCVIDYPLLILRGWAARIRILSDGRLQILGLKVAGALVGYSLQPEHRAAATLVAIASVTFCTAPERATAALRRGYAASVACREGYLLDQIVRVGRMTAAERLQDFLAELERLRLS